MKSIILASASPRRVQLLSQVGIDFTVVPSSVTENIDGALAPEELAIELSYRKASNVAEKLKGRNDCREALVIGADTIVVKEVILGKPENEEDAFRMLGMLAGEWHEVITGLSVVAANGLKEVKGFELTRVKMRELSEEEIRSYVRTGEPLDKAGAYGIQGIGASLVERIEGCYFNVVGLPLNRLCFMLKEFGVKVL